MMLYQLGTVQFDVAPLNVAEVERSDGADFVAKDIVGGMKPLEFVGEQNQRLRLSGMLYPHKLGGLIGLEALQNMAVSGEPKTLTRGDFVFMGYYVVERLEQKHGYLNNEGIGREIKFEISLVQSQKPSTVQALKTELALQLGVIESLFA